MNVTKRILQNVNFRAKKSSVCALLGQSGAGKTTLVSVLAGLESSTNDQTKIETSGEVGFCPQFDFLWPQLTVREHLRLRLVFSGSRSQKAKEMAATMATADIDIPRNQLSSRRSRLNSPSRTNSTSKSQHFLAGKKESLAFAVAFKLLDCYSR